MVTKGVTFRIKVPTQKISKFVCPCCEQVLFFFQGEKSEIEVLDNNEKE